MSVPVSAEVKRGLASMAVRLLVVNGCNDVRSGTSAGPSS
jgi:hypothetical protein